MTDEEVKITISGDTKAAVDALWDTEHRLWQLHEQLLQAGQDDDDEPEPPRLTVEE